MKNLRYFLLFLVTLLTGCVSMNIPMPINTPLFEKKNEVEIEAGASTNSIFAAVNYAFTNKYAFIANGSMSFRNFSKWYDLSYKVGDEYQGSGGGGNWFDLSELFNNDNPYKHRSVEAGFGRYNILNINKLLFLEAFAGASYGDAKIIDNEYYKFDSWHALGFVQANFGLKLKNILECGFSTRFQYSYLEGKQTYLMDTQSEIKKFNINAFHWQQFGFCKIGNKHIKGVVRLGINIPLYSENKTVKTNGLGYGYTLLHFSIGMNCSF